MKSLADPHHGQPVLSRGKLLAEAKAVMILLHGRGATAESILTLSDELYHPNLAYLAPQAAGNTWYLYSFLSPIAQNEPGITSGISAVSRLVDHILQTGIPANKLILAGFSQGACLTLEFAARHARQYGAILGFSGGLIGPDDTPRNYPGSFDGTPIFLGCSDVDFHIPKERVWHTAGVLQGMGADVTTRLYAGMGHTINQDEIEMARALVTAVLT